MDGGAICPSQSPWCNAVVLVCKKDGGLQFCINFSRLNSRTKKDAYPLPQMQETMESMVGTQFFFTMDLKSGFWQVKLAKDFPAVHRTSIAYRWFSPVSWSMGSN